jgi:opacity protein-like surface antigen
MEFTMSSLASSRFAPLACADLSPSRLRRWRGRGLLWSAAAACGVALSLGFSGVSHAQTTSSSLPSESASGAQWVALSAGAAQAQLDCDGATNCDRNAPAWKLSYGRLLAPNWGFQVEMLQHQDARVTAPSGGASTTGNFNTRGAALYGLAIGETDRWSYWGKAGVTILESRGTPGVAQIAQDDKETNARVGLGLGVGLRLTPQLQARLEYDRLRNELLGRNVDIDLWTIGLAARF